MAIPLGLKHHNYLNVKNGASPWLDVGEKPSKSDAKGHAIFKDPAWGVRAGILLLRTYFLKHALKTISAIIHRWAPASDGNKPEQYAQFVSERTGLGTNQKLQLFDTEGQIEELDQLKKLFFAMAAMEIGAVNGKLFKVPEKDFAAGAELVEPGITDHGTESTDIEGPQIIPVGVPVSLSDSVGTLEKAKNVTRDVRAVQLLLRKAAEVLGNPAIDPGTATGTVGASSKTSPTVKAIIAFQARFFTRPDGVVDPDGRTWRELLGTVQGGQTGPTPDVGATGTVPANVPKTGFCIYLRRIRQEVRPGKGFSRTIGEYQCYWNGGALAALRGQIVERGGPGDNTTAIGNAFDRRVEAKSYPLRVHSGLKYKTFNYSVSVTGKPKPGLLLGKTGQREAILIHPGVGYLSSIGCLNPTAGLTNANSDINFTESRRRTIAIIETMKTLMGNSFPSSGEIPHATILIEGLK